MQRQRCDDTVPELMLRRALHARGLRFRKGLRGLPGRPDIVFPRARLAIFVDGCFWHRCPQHRSMPKNNGAWWDAKLQANVERDRRQDAALRDAAWTVLRVWEHEDVDVAADNIEALWRRLRTDPSGSPRRHRR
ncbi:MAG: very short patch repair endonuclease [Pseudonocardiaceae bacterium]